MRFILKHKRLIIITIILLFIYQMCRNRDSYEIFLPDSNLYFKLERIDGYVRLSISHSDKFGTDYVDFDYRPIFYPKLYFIDPDTLYFIEEYSSDFRSMKEDRFIIKRIDIISLPEFGHYKDSAGVWKTKTPHGYFEKKAIRDEQEKECKNIADRATYAISIGDYASGITIFNNQVEIIAKDESPFVLAAH